MGDRQGFGHGYRGIVILSYALLFWWDRIHESSIASNLLGILKQEAEKRGLSKIMDVTVVVGRLRALNLETLSFIFDAIASDAPLTAEASLTFKKNKGLAKCKECGHEWQIGPKNLDSGEMDLLHYGGVVESLQLTCPQCGAKNFEIKEGRELYICEIEAEKEEADT